MLKSKTVFVIGAGASAEAGLPIGEQLTEHIARLVDLSFESWGNVRSGDEHIVNATQQFLPTKGQAFVRQLQLAGAEMAEAMQLVQSIDTYLETHSSNPHIVTMGKLGIVRAIAMAEAKSKLAAQRGEQLALKKVGDTWYRSLARLLFNGVPAHRPEQALEDASFIVFNYDRCLERFLLRALAVNFRIAPERAAELVRGITIHHPYGWLGSILPDNRGLSVGYGAEAFDLVAASERILTYSEQVEDGDMVKGMRQLIDEAETIVFLGFAFHEQNMALLHPGDERSPNRPPAKRVFASTFKTSESDTQIIRDQICDLVHDRPEHPSDKDWLVTYDGTCADLFGQFWRSLSAEPLEAPPAAMISFQLPG